MKNSTLYGLMQQQRILVTEIANLLVEYSKSLEYVIEGLKMNKEFPLSIESTNEFTGEIFEIQVDANSIDDVVSQLLAIQKQRKSLDTIESQLKNILEKHLASNDYKPIPTRLNYDVRYIQSNTKSYDATIVWNHIDHDLLMSKGVISIANGKLEALMTELVRENGLASEDSRAILDNVTIKPCKPYVVLEKRQPSYKDVKDGEIENPFLDPRA